MSATPGMRIGQLAGAAGVTTRTVRHYESVGLLEPARRDASGYRRYSDAHLERLVSILRLRGLGMPLHRISFLLDDQGRPTPEMASALLQLKREAAEEAARLELVQRDLTALVVPLSSSAPRWPSRRASVTQEDFARMGALYETLADTHRALRHRHQNVMAAVSRRTGRECR